MKKIKVKPTRTNIFVIDEKAKENRSARKRGFFTVDEATEYIENHERPNDLFCIFDKGFEKSYLDKVKREIAQNRIREIDIKVLRLIELGNYKLAIEKYLRIEIEESLTRLKNNGLIEYSYSDLSITPKGERFLK